MNEKAQLAQLQALVKHLLERAQDDTEYGRCCLRLVRAFHLKPKEEPW